jgi:hypothetical protein
MVVVAHPGADAARVAAFVAAVGDGAHRATVHADGHHTGERKPGE